MPYGYRVFTEAERPSQALLDHFAQVATPDLADVMQHSNVVDGDIRPIYHPMARFVGPAVTVSLPDGAFNVLKMGMEMTQAGDVLVIAAGELVRPALDAAETLAAQGISAEVIDMFTFKPLDHELILREAKGKKRIIVAENHNVIGGLGSAVAETLADAGCGVPRAAR